MYINIKPNYMTETINYINKETGEEKIVRESNMSKSDCPYFSENAPVCDDGECGCFECMERIAELRTKGE